MVGETAEDVGGIGCVVINRILEVAVRPLGELPVICSAVKRLIVVVEQAVGDEVGGVPGLGVLQIIVARVVPAAIPPIVRTHIVLLVLPQEKSLEAAMDCPKIRVRLADSGLVADREALDRQAYQHGKERDDPAEGSA